MSQTLEATQDDVRIQLRDLVSAQLTEDLAGRVTFAPGGLGLITRVIDDLLDDQELLPAVDAALVIGHYLETELKAPACARGLVDVVNRPVVLEALERLNRRRHEKKLAATELGAEEFNRFAQRRPNIPKILPDAEARANAPGVKLNSLSFPKRL